MLFNISAGLRLPQGAAVRDEQTLTVSESSNSFSISDGIPYTTTGFGVSDTPGSSGVTQQLTSAASASYYWFVATEAFTGIDQVEFGITAVAATGGGNNCRVSLHKLSSIPEYGVSLGSVLATADALPAVGAMRVTLGSAVNIAVGDIVAISVTALSTADFTIRTAELTTQSLRVLAGYVRSTTSASENYLICRPAIALRNSGSSTDYIGPELLLWGNMSSSGTRYDIFRSASVNNVIGIRIAPPLNIRLSHFNAVISKNGTPTGPLTAYIVQNGVVKATCSNPMATTAGHSTTTPRTFYFASPPLLVKGNSYEIILEQTSGVGSASNCWRALTSGSNSARPFGLTDPTPRGLFSAQAITSTSLGSYTFTTSNTNFIFIQIGWKPYYRIN